MTVLRSVGRSSRTTTLPPDRLEETTVVVSSPATRRAPTEKRSESSLAPSTTKEPSRPCGRPTRPTGTRSVTEPLLVDDLELDALVLVRSARAHDRPQRACDAPLAPDHLADVCLGDAQLEHGRAVALDPGDFDLVGVVDEALGQVGDQVFQPRRSPVPSSAAARSRSAAPPSRSSPSPSPRRSRSSRAESAGCIARRSR